MIASYAQLLTAAFAFIGTAAAVKPVEVDGKDFVNSDTKDRFQIIGVDYQPGGSSGANTDADPLSDADACYRDAALMQRLGVNTIRIYNLQPSLDHNECASIFNAAGIYMILDVNSPLKNGALDRTAPKDSYNAEYYQQVFGIIEAFKNFDNVLGFFAGNEVINEDAVESVPAYVRAVVRDMKQYIAKNSDRAIPVGYSAADVRPILTSTAAYFECELDDSDSQLDFFGLNSYSWCGDATYKSSGYNVLVEDFTNATLPVFFSEYGCNDVTPRTFSEVQALYGEEMTQAFSGGLVYEFTEADNNYGLVKINNSDTVTTLVDFDNLQKQFAKIDIDRITTNNKTQTSIDAPKCDASLITAKGFLDSWDLPEAPSKVSDYIKNGLPDAPSGSPVTVSGKTISQKVYDSTGKEITGVKYEVRSNNDVNTPGSTGSSGSSTSSASSTGTSTGAASINSAPLAMTGVSGFFMLLASLL